MSEQIALGLKAYAAYAAACKGKDGLGRDLNPWETMSKSDQQVWIMTAMAMRGQPEEAPYEVQSIEGLVGELAYNAYCGHVGWKGFNGDPLPEWGNAREHIRDGWRKAGVAVMHATMNPEAKPEAAGAPVEDQGDSAYPTRASRVGALKYVAVANCPDGCGMPTFPIALEAEDLGPHIANRLIAMERQGYWSDVRQNRIPLQEVTYTISVAEEVEDEVSEEG